IDVTDAAALERLIAEVRGVHGDLSGVIHSAGVLRDSFLIKKTAQQLQDVFAPKVQGLVNLERATHDQALDYFITFSSIAATHGNVGQGDYAAANAFMDARMAQRQSERQATHPNERSLSINWPLWEEGGMQIDAASRERLWSSLGLSPLPNEAGLQALHAALAQSAAQLVVLHGDAKRLLPGMQLHPLTAPDSARPTTDKLPERTQAWLHGFVAEQLRLQAAQLDMNTPLQEYGVDSVLLTQLLKTLGQRLGIGALDPTAFYEHPSVSAFAAWLVARHPAALAQVARGVPAADGMPSSDASTPPVALQLPAAPPRIPHAGGGREGQGADIAVVAMSCHFPGSPDLDAYWRLLREGRSAIRPVPDERWGHRSDHVAGVLDGLGTIDPRQFLISPADAAAMDPQALLLLDECRKLWAQAGYTTPELKGQAIGVYLGGRSRHRPSEERLAAAHNPILASSPNYLATNLSHYYDLRGPSLVVDTACSSALVAMNLAMQALHCGEISAAVVGGVNLLESDAALRLFDQRGILNRGPRFHLFDARASGAILSEGVGLVLVKRLEDALNDGDQVYAVIKGLAINNDGRTLGAAAPNPQAHKDVMHAALAKSGRLPSEIDYIEVNGSGTLATDLLELKTIESVYRAGSDRPCQLGSMKPNIGHPLCAEGIAGLIKVALMLHHREWVPFLSAQQPIDHYDLAQSPFRFSRSAAEWEGRPRVAALSCFADGGTNAHLVLQGWEADPARPARRQPLAAATTQADAAAPAVEPADSVELSLDFWSTADASP
ncbi:MAG: beta-ketoacyl synthase N-terminal-like domain-containing protein, partial [Rhizobacter sp.]